MAKIDINDIDMENLDVRTYNILMRDGYIKVKEDEKMEKEKEVKEQKELGFFDRLKVKIFGNNIDYEIDKNLRKMKMKDVLTDNDYPTCVENLERLARIKEQIEKGKDPKYKLLGTVLTLFGGILLGRAILNFERGGDTVTSKAMTFLSKLVFKV